MNIFDLDFDQSFTESFTTSGGPVTECICGKEHVCINSDYFDKEEDAEMIARYWERNDKDENLVLHTEWDYVTQVEVGGQYFVAECDCKGWERYMEFILVHRHQIAGFLIRVSDKVQIALENEKTFNKLKDTTL